MNRGETKTQSPRSASYSTTSSVRPPLPVSRASFYLQSLRKADRSTSAPSATAESPDWVSPFTLPPLPAFHRNRNIGPKSPEEHKRSNSSLFYAAAWGSPYATPPQENSPSVKSSSSRARAESKSSASGPEQPSSPSRFPAEWLPGLSSSGSLVARYLYSPQKRPSDEEAGLHQQSSADPTPDASERPNWLSDPEDSGESDIEALPGDEVIKTPTRALFAKLRAGSFGFNQNPGSAHHKQASTATVTPDSFNALHLNLQELKALSTTEVSSMAVSGEMHERYSVDPGSPATGKPLPSLPRRRTSTFNIDGTIASPTSPNRPKLGSAPSFQRPKKQVLWKGKKCIIGMPLEDRVEAGLPPLLSQKEIQDRLENWKRDGYDITPFSLGDTLEYTERGSGHSRPVYPDSSETLRERERRQYRVNVPNQAEWDAWVDFMREQKLRALGVSSSNSDTPPSRRSPGVMTPRATSYSAKPDVILAHPTPRSHKHQLSAALQKSVDDAAAGRINYKDADVVDGDQSRLHSEDEVEPLPILKRPETMLEDSVDIITNPSNEPSPIPRDDRDLLMRWPVINQTRSESVKSHKTQSSMSKLNVEAPEFNPATWKSVDPASISQNALGGSNGPYGQAGSRPSSISSTPFVFGTDSTEQRVAASWELTMNLSFNPDAAAFAPSFASMSAQPMAAFSFSSAPFNVEAPEFDPTAPPEINFGTSWGSAAGPGGPNVRIFDEIVIDPTLKPQRRSGKTLPSLRPRSKDGPENILSWSEPESDGNNSAEAEDEHGRPQVPPERLKRSRRAGSDGDRSPVYADWAPFGHGKRSSVDHRSILSEIVNNADSAPKLHNIPTKTQSVDGWGYIPAEPEQRSPKDIENLTPAELDGDDSPTNPWSPFKSANERQATEINAANSPARSGGIASPHMDNITDGECGEDFRYDISKGVSEIARRSVDVSDAKIRSRGPEFISTFGSPLSAPGRPSEHHIPLSPQPVQETDTAKPAPNMPQETLASRFAPSPRGPISPALSPQILSSPPPEMYSYIKAEDSSTGGLLDHNVPVHPSSSVKGPHREESPLERHSEIIVQIEETSEEDAQLGRAYDHSETMSISASSGQHSGDAVPSYEEIDAVIRHLEQNPELGVERAQTPPDPSVRLTEMVLPNNFRSDAPSPSPRRHPQREQQSSSTIPDLKSPIHTYGLGIGVHKLTDGTENVSDWNDTLSPSQEDKLQSRVGFFDGHVNELVDGILESRLGPLEQSLRAIQDSMSVLAGRPTSRRRPSMSSDVNESDADDEDDYNASESYTERRPRSAEAVRKTQKPQPDRIKAAVMEAMAAHQHPSEVPLANDIAELRATLEDMKELAQRSAGPANQMELKTVVEDVIATHPRLRGQRFGKNHDSEDKVKLQVHGLETMLKVANERADEEVRCRHTAEDELADVQRRLTAAEEEAAQYRESAEETEQSVRAFVKEKEAFADLEQTVADLENENKALKSTLDEYRESHEHWQEETRKLKERNRHLEDAVDVARDTAQTLAAEETRSLRHENEDLQHALANIQEQLHERTRSREAHRDTVDRLRGEVEQLAHTIAFERAEATKTEHELRIKYSTILTSLDFERRRMEKTEQEMADLHRNRDETLHLKASYAHAQEETSRLQAFVGSLQEERRIHEDNAHQLERELATVRERATDKMASAAAKLETDLERLNAQLTNTRADAQEQISRLQNRVDTAELDLEEQKAKHDATLSEMQEHHGQALHELVEKRDNVLQEQHATHERKLNDLRERHTRALHNSSDDRHRLEHHLNEKLSLSDDKVKHLESKVQDLEERLEITKSAARAAVEAATKQSIDPPTPAPSTVTSPPHVTLPSLRIEKGTEIPEKISPQALRETIMVLQEQLQHREQRVEKLEAEIAELDKDAPKRVQGLETEASWLRELLSVRRDDIDELVNTLSADDVSDEDFDRKAVKDAAIRLRANLAMETQLKEHAMAASTTIGNLPNSISLPSIASLSNTISQVGSPRAFPMAAAAAWGNWRKARDSSYGVLSDLAGNLSGTPTKPSTTVGRSSSFGPAGMKYGSSNAVHSSLSPSASTPTAAARPLAQFAAARKGSTDRGPRPLRAYSAQPRVLNAQNKETELGVVPVTPTMRSRVGSHPSDGGLTLISTSGLEFGQDVDEDASPL